MDHGGRKGKKESDRRVNKEQTNVNMEPERNDRARERKGSELDGYFEVRVFRMYVVCASVSLR